jgi:hypothetical protein
MPPRWSRKPDRADPEYRKLDDRMNFAVHVAIFAAVNSGLWFFRVLGSTSELGDPGGFAATPLVTEIWGALLAAHALFIFAIAKYPEVTPNKPSKPTAIAAGKGKSIQSNSKKKPAKSEKVAIPATNKTSSGFQPKPEEKPTKSSSRRGTR